MIETPTYPATAVGQVRALTPSTSLGVAAGLSTILLAALWLAGGGSLLRLAIPAMATFFALILYLRYPILYVQYSLWVWFLAPLVRRVVDWHFGWANPNFILLSPLLVSGIAGLAFLRKDSKAWSDIPPAFVLSCAAILYGFVVGMVLHLRPSAEIAYGLLNWLCPLIFGFHFYLNWTFYEQHSAAILRAFLWGVLIMGIYGVFQFLAPAEWDRFWLNSLIAEGTGASVGQPESLLVRVWSTMNAPGPFANTMMVGLLLLFTVRSRLKLPAAVAGYVAFLLSSVRTAWLSWVVGLVWILTSTKPRVIARILISLALLVVCLLPFVSDPRLAPVVTDRLTTFTDLGHDSSFNDREQMYRVLINDALHNPVGTGLKNEETSHGAAVDSGLLVLVFSLGWFGSLLLLAGTALLFLMRQGPRGSGRDEFSNAAMAVMIALLAQLVGGNIFVGVNGAMFWMFAGTFLAAGRYQRAREQVAFETA